MGGVAIEHRGVTGRDLVRVVEDNDLSLEVVGDLRGILLGVTTNVTTLDVLDGDRLNVETNVVTGGGLFKLLVVHLDGLDFSGDERRSELDNHCGLQYTSLDTAD